MSKYPTPHRNEEEVRAYCESYGCSPDDRIRFAKTKLKFKKTGFKFKTEPRLSFLGAGRSN